MKQFFSLVLMGLLFVGVSGGPAQAQAQTSGAAQAPDVKAKRLIVTYQGVKYAGPSSVENPLIGAWKLDSTVDKNGTRVSFGSGLQVIRIFTETEIQTKATNAGLEDVNVRPVAYRRIEDQPLASSSGEDELNVKFVNRNTFEALNGDMTVVYKRINGDAKPLR